MARADLLISLIKAGNRGDQTSFKRAAESLIAEERAKKHDVLADRLTEIIKNDGKANGLKLSDSVDKDFLFEINPDQKFDNLILSTETLNLCEEIVEEHHRAELLRSYGLEPRNRILLTGPPGNGKTSLAEAISYHLMYPFLVVRYENLIGSFLGETASRLQRVFDYVRTRRCVLFFDEFDTIGKERGDTKETGEIKRVVSSLLLQMDKLPSYVVVITASNHQELLDRAVWRRFQIRINLPLPTKNQIEDYINRFVSRIEINLGYSTQELSEKMDGHSFAEIEEFCTDILRQSILKHKQENAKSIVNLKLKQWENRKNVKP